MIVAELKRPNVSDLLAGVMVNMDLEPVRLRQLAEVDVLANERLRALGVNDLEPRRGQLLEDLGLHQHRAHANRVNGLKPFAIMRRDELLHREVRPRHGFRRHPARRVVAGHDVLVMRHETMRNISREPHVAVQKQRVIGFVLQGHYRQLLPLVCDQSPVDHVDVKRGAWRALGVPIRRKQAQIIRKRGMHGFSCRNANR